MMGITRTFIERPIFLLMVELFLLVLGVMGYMRIGVDQYPDIQPPVISVSTSYPGAGPAEVETLVTKAIEEEVSQIGGIDRVMSTSRDGLSQIVINFDLDIDIKEVQNEVRDKVSRVRPSLPLDIDEPLIQRLDFADRPILQLAMRLRAGADAPISEARLRRIAEDQLKPLLQQVDGVGQVDVFGGLEREIQVQLDPGKLQTWRLTPGDVAQAVRVANVNIPAGDIREQPVRRALRIVGEYQNVNEIAATVVRSLPGGRAVTLADLGEVRDTFKEKDSFARLAGQPAVMIEIKKVTDANTVAVAAAIQQSLTKIGKQLPENLEVVTAYDGARKIKMSVADVIETLIIAAILAVVVVYFFLGSWQSTFITGISLPAVIINSFFALYMFGFTLNVMTLLGLTLAVGLLLDDAIVVRENIWNKLEKGMAPREASIEGTREVLVAVLATSLTVLAVFIPVTFIPGVVGRFFAAFALTVVICVIFSTIDALTVAPTLSALMVPKESGKPWWLLRFFNAIGNRCSIFYQRTLFLVLQRPGRTLAVSGAIFVSSLFLMKWIGFTFMPADDSGEIEVAIETPPGTSIGHTNAIARIIEDIVSAIPGRDFVSVRVGNDFGDSNIATVFVQLLPEEKRELNTDQTRTLIRNSILAIAKQENLSVTVGNPGGGGGPGKPIQAVITGPDIETLVALSNQITRIVERDVPGALNLESNLKPGRSEVKFLIDRPKTAAFGLDSQRVGQTIRGLFEGELAGVYREDGEEYDIRVTLGAAHQQSPANLQKFTMPNDRHEAIPLAAVTRMDVGMSPTKMVRIDQQRAAMIQGDLAPGAALGTVISQMETIISGVLPEQYRLSFQGQAESLRDLGIGAITALLLGALFIYMIMASLYESLVIPLAILLTLPLAIVGALLALFVSGKLMDVYAVIGLILLMGLVTKNAILLVDYAEQLMKSGMKREDALMEAGVRRLRPIMMTTIAMIAGMAPVAAGMGELNKIRAGMGLASIGGLISSTVLSLVVVPCAYVYLDRMRVYVRRRVQNIYKAAEVPKNVAPVSADA